MVPYNKRDMTNYKPFRTKALKAEAKRKAVKCVDGAYRANVAVYIGGIKVSASRVESEQAA